MYDFATAPIWISLYSIWEIFYFIFYQCVFPSPFLLFNSSFPSSFTALSPSFLFSFFCSFSPASFLSFSFASSYFFLFSYFLPILLPVFNFVLRSLHIVLLVSHIFFLLQLLYLLFSLFSHFFSCPSFYNCSLLTFLFYFYFLSLFHAIHSFLTLSFHPVFPSPLYHKLVYHSPPPRINASIPYKIHLFNDESQPYSIGKRALQ